MTNFWSGGMRENETKCHQGSLLCCIWQCLWATLSVSQKSWATAAIREDRHFQSRFLGGGWEEGQRERRREWGEKGGVEMKAGHILYSHDITLLLWYIYREWPEHLSEFTHSQSQLKARESPEGALLQCLSVWTCLSEGWRMMAGLNIQLVCLMLLAFSSWSLCSGKPNYSSQLPEVISLAVCCCSG